MISSVLRFALILLAAAVLAVVARALFVARGQETPAPPPPDVLVRIAATDLPAGLLLRENDLEWKSMPASDVPKDALRQGSAQADLAGALVRRHVGQGTVLTTADFMRNDAPGFLAAVLKPGMRAVSVPIDDVSGNAGLIQPGDAVDMILTQRLDRAGGQSRSGSASVVSETVVQNARVIAVGSSFQTQSSEQFKPTRARTVTLEVDPRAAEAVTVAAELGSLSLSLRSFALDRQDGQIVDLPTSASVVAWDPNANEARPVWGDDVSHALRAVRGPAAPATSPLHQTTDGLSIPPASRAAHSIIIMRGPNTQEQTFPAGGARP